MPKRTLKPIFPPAGIEKKYEKRLKRAVREMEKSCVYWLRARYRANESKIMDSATDDLLKQFRKLLHQWERNFRELSETLPEWFVNKVRGYVHTNLVQQTKPLRDAGLGFNLNFSYMSQKERQTFAAIVAENVNLIKSIAKESLTQVEGIVLRSIENGHDLSTLTENLHHQFGVSERRAAMIARDQTNKATSNLSRERLKEYGITKGIWMHTASGKTYRETHVLSHEQGGMDGAEYFLEEGCFDPDANIQDYIQPAELVNCYCVCRPLIPELTPEETESGIDEILNEAEGIDTIRTTEDYADRIESLNTDILAARQVGNVVEESKLLSELERVKVDAAKNNVVFTSGLDPMLLESDSAFIRSQLAQAPEDVRILWNKFEDKMKIMSKNSTAQYYLMSDNGVYLNLPLNRNSEYGMSKFQTLFHENSHFINWNVEKGKTFSHTFENGVFAKTLKQEASEYVNAIYNEMKKTSSSFVYKQAAYKKVEEELFKIPLGESMSVADIFNGATKSKIRDGWTHPIKYWNDASLSDEAFAEFTAATICNPKDLANIKKYFPKSYRVYLRMVKAMSKRRRS